MENVVTKDNLTDLLHQTPQSGGSSNNSNNSGSKPSDQSSSTGKPSGTATSNERNIINLGQTSSKIK